jgi:hypothetical protein
MGLTVTVQVAVLLPSAVVTVMVAFPTATPVTVQHCETKATSVLLLLHVTFLLAALFGVMFANKASDPPTVKVVAVLFKVTSVTETDEELTVTAQDDVKLPSAVLTVIVALPAATPLTVPPCETEAMLGALLLHETDLLSALEGKMLADKVSEPPTVKVVNALFKETLFTGVVSGEELSQDTIEQTITAIIDVIPINLT